MITDIPRRDADGKPSQCVASLDQPPVESGARVPFAAKFLFLICLPHVQVCSAKTGEKRTKVCNRFHTSHRGEIKE